MLPVDKVFKVDIKLYNSIGSSVCDLICILKIIQAIGQDLKKQQLHINYILKKSVFYVLLNVLSNMRSK